MPPATSGPGPADRPAIDRPLTGGDGNAPTGATDTAGTGSRVASPRASMRTVDPVEDSWMVPRTERAGHVFRVQAGIGRAVRELLDGMGFVEVVPPILGPVTDPGIRGAKQASVDYYGREYKLMSSAILYKQMMAAGLGKIYMFAPCIRLEPLETATTRRHLTEFFQIDLEEAGADHHRAMDVAEALVRHVTHRIWETHAGDLEAIDAPRWAFSEHRDFPRLTHARAVEMLADHGREVDPHAEIPWEEEAFLSSLFDVPVFVHDYPKGCRGFYDREDPDRPGILRDFDLIYPGGYGEAISGAEREHELDRVVARLRETGEDPKKYGWYIDMLREGVPRTAGFGIGLERLTRFVCGLDSVVEARPYPKVAGVRSP